MVSDLRSYLLVKNTGFKHVVKVLSPATMSLHLCMLVSPLSCSCSGIDKSESDDGASLTFVLFIFVIYFSY